MADDYLKVFREDYTKTFSLDRFPLIKRGPLYICQANRPAGGVKHRVNHYLIRQPWQGYKWGELSGCGFIYHLVKESAEAAIKAGILDIFDRYLYVTIDNAPVKAGETQRMPGWHVDGLQGDEVTEKKPGDISFIWCDKVPPEFAVQDFNVNRLDMSKHNIFNALGDQVREESIIKALPECLYMFSAYQVHRATVAEEDTDRLFVRIGYTHTPITATKMTINPEMDYNYPIHTTDGQVPAHLI